MAPSCQECCPEVMGTSDSSEVAEQRQVSIYELANDVSGGPSDLYANLAQELAAAPEPFVWQRRGDSSNTLCKWATGRWR